MQAHSFLGIQMASYFSTWLSAIKPYPFISILIGLILLFLGATGTRVLGADSRISSIETRVTTIETTHVQINNKIDALLRVSCLNDRTKSQLAGIQCP